MIRLLWSPYRVGRPNYLGLWRGVEGSQSAAGILAAEFRSYLIWGHAAGWLIALLVALASRTWPQGKLARIGTAPPVMARQALRVDPASYPVAARWLPDRS
jgi:hypothetical protein